MRHAPARRPAPAPVDDGAPLILGQAALAERITEALLTEARRRPGFLGRVAPTAAALERTVREIVIAGATWERVEGVIAWSRQTGQDGEPRGLAAVRNTIRRDPTGARVPVAAGGTRRGGRPAAAGTKAAARQDGITHPGGVTDADRERVANGGGW